MANTSAMPKDLKRWEATRQKGQKHYVFHTGFLRFGVLLFIAMTFFVYPNQMGKITIPMVLISAFFWSLGGILFGWLMWLMNEKRYHAFNAKMKASST